MAQHAWRKLRLPRVAGWIALTVLILIPLLGISAPSASAQQVACEGDVIRGSCVVDLGPPVCVAPAVFDGAESCVTTVAPEPVPTCPDGALGDPGGCYILVAKETADPTCVEGVLVGNQCVITGDAPTLSCPAGFEPGEMLCTRSEPASEIPPACPDGALGEPSGCYVLVAKEAPDPTCVEGELVGANCVITGDAPTLSCPDGYEIDEALGGICARFEPASEIPPACPDGALGEPGGCYILVAKGPSGAPTCPEGTLEGLTCVIVGAPPVQGPATCPVSATVILQDGRCFTLIARDVNGDCPPGTTASTNGLDCERPVDLRPGPLTCAEGFGIVDGQCIRYEAPVTPVPQCPPGSVEDGNGDCRKPVAEIPTSYFCIDPAAALNGRSCVYTIGFIRTCAPTFGLINGECIRFEAPITPAPQCPPGSVDDGNGDCRKPVADTPTVYFCSVPGAVLIGRDCVITVGFIETCAPTFGLVNSECIRFEAPVIPAPHCPPGSVEDGNGDCRKPVADGPDDLVCPEGTEFGIEVCTATTPAVCDAGQLSDGSCIESTPLALCDGQLVTINMRLGDSGNGTSGNDVILGTSGADRITARGGDDVICAGGGDDIIYGGSGNDNILGQGGNDDIRGGSGNDTIRGGSGADLIRGGSDQDDIRGGSGNDDIRAQGGDDIVRGGRGDDDIRGGSGNDDLRGGSDTDVLRGGTGDDALRGGAGASDECIGNAGTDTAAGSCEITASIP